MQYNIENKTLICIGDVHGEFATLRFKLAQYIKKYGLTDTIFIVCGDCGFYGPKYDYSWRNRERDKIHQLLLKSDNQLYFFRGNHDNPLFFTSDTDYITDNLSTIKVLKDYDILNSFLYGKILIVPGAASIDRCYQIQNNNWWEDEVVVKLPDEKIDSLAEFDLVLSHSLPYNPPLNNSLLLNFQNYEKDYKAKFEVSLSNYLQIETNYLKHLQEKIKAKQWISGHYHKSSEILIDNIKYISLDIMEFYEPSYN